MEEPVRALVAFGTRPEAVKMAPVVRALGADPAFDVRVLSTAQHREMLDQVTRLFGLRVDYDLDAMRERGLACASPAHDDLHALVSAEYYAFFEIVRHDTSKEDAVARIKLIVDFFRPGWENLFGG